MGRGLPPPPPPVAKVRGACRAGLVQNNNMRVAAVLVLCCALAEGATKNKWKDKKCVKKHAQGLCAATNCPKKAKKCEKTATRRRLYKKEERPAWRGRDSAPPLLARRARRLVAPHPFLHHPHLQILLSLFALRG